MWAVCEGTVRAILDAVASGVCLIHTCAGLVVAEVVASLRVPGRAVQVGAAAGRGEERVIQRVIMWGCGSSHHIRECVSPELLTTTCRQDIPKTCDSIGCNANHHNAGEMHGVNIHYVYGIGPLSFRDLNCHGYLTNFAHSPSSTTQP